MKLTLSIIIIILISFITIMAVLVIIGKKLPILSGKIKLSTDIATIYLDMINRKMGLVEFSDNELLKRIMDIKRDLLLFGSDDLIKKFNEWEENINTNKRLWNWIELMCLSRNEIWIKRTKLTPDDVLKSLLPPNEDYKSLKKEWGVE